MNMHKRLSGVFVLPLLLTIPLVFNFCGEKEEKKEIMQIVTPSGGKSASQTGVVSAGKRNEAIYAVFSAYKKALLDADGSKACKIVCSNTLRWYADTHKEALSLDRKEFDKKDIMKKFFIVRLRHEFTKKEAEQMTGEEMFIAGVKNGWIGSGQVRDISLDRVEEKGDTALGYTAAAPNTPIIFFVKENGKWKVSLFASFPIVTKTLKHYADSSNMSENEWIISTINSISSKKVNPRILDEYVL